VEAWVEETFRKTTKLMT